MTLQTLTDERIAGLAMENMTAVVFEGEPDALQIKQAERILSDSALAIGIGRIDGKTYVIGETLTPPPIEVFTKDQEALAASLFVLESGNLPNRVDLPARYTKLFGETYPKLTDLQISGIVNTFLSDFPTK